MPVNVLILGASYGSLLAIKLLAAGHNVHLVCQAATSALINGEGIRVRMPIKGLDGLTEIDSRRLPGSLSASPPAGLDPSTFDLVALAMQEPQYSADGVRQLLERIAVSRVPCMSIMNIPPLPYLARIPGIDAQALKPCFDDPDLWASFEPGCLTVCSPDPQAFRPPDEKGNVLQVRLPTNFKAARFASDVHTDLLVRLQNDIDAVRHNASNGVPSDVPVKLKVHQSLFVPLAKWPMLMAGNYRSIQKEAMRPIKDALHSDLAASARVYDWVVALCVSMGADASDMVPFDKYAAAAASLGSPSSAARALIAGSTKIERIDLLVQSIAAQRGMRLDVVDTTVALVESWLARNRAQPG